VNDTILGAWQMCDDGRCHHFLRGYTLCGSRARATGPVPTQFWQAPGKKVNLQPDCSDYCPTCKLKNAQRWSEPPYCEPDPPESV
jgi:hypothetical protein